ncbi:hypothetical protein LWI28_004375 [Acer negundo]|uniref:SWIM-type domain-containing protein n=1 Tax=Acer negundo TaxID=4023 RepID=A0AAD5I8E4_ACENE|nr:hypothetical protein LWI28_004375 [Acer negundo]
MHELLGLESVPGEKFRQEVLIPWGEEEREIRNDAELLDVLGEFEQRNVSQIHFNVNYIPPAVMYVEHPNQQPNNNPNKQPIVNPIQQPNNTPRQQYNQNPRKQPNNNSIQQPKLSPEQDPIEIIERSSPVDQDGNYCSDECRSYYQSSNSEGEESDNENNENGDEMHNANNDNEDENDSLSDVNEDGISQEVVVDIGSDSDSDIQRDPPNRGTAFRVGVDGRITIEESNIPPAVNQKLQKAQLKGRYLDPLRCGEYEFEIINNDRQLVVKLDKHTCDCGLWVISGIPCKHAMACITKTRDNVENYMDDYLKKAAYPKTYSNKIHAIPDENLWPEDQFETVLPPVKRRRAGRPRLSRKKGPNELMRVQRSVGFRCGKCKEVGHNSRTCKKNPTIATASTAPSMPQKVPKRKINENGTSSTHYGLDSIHVGPAAVTSRNAGAVSEHGGNASSNSGPGTTIGLGGPSTCTSGTITRSFPYHPNLHLNLGLMANDKPESSIPEPSTLESSIPVICIQSENFGFQADVILTEVNYDVWSLILEMQIVGREKLEYIMGKTAPPTPYVKCYAENQKVKGWLLTSTSPEIMKHYLRLRTACEIWNALAKAFYNGSDELQLFALNQQAFSTKQVGRSLSTYYGELVAIFQQLDYFPRTGLS